MLLTLPSAQWPTDAFDLTKRRWRAISTSSVHETFGLQAERAWLHGLLQSFASEDPLIEVATRALQSSTPAALEQPQQPPAALQQPSALLPVALQQPQQRLTPAINWEK
jgi:hypothetical protein